jgi:hypothetical protein
MKQHDTCKFCLRTIPAAAVYVYVYVLVGSMHTPTVFICFLPTYDMILYDTNITLSYSTEQSNHLLQYGVDIKKYITIVL